jgi:hypothetical protein
MHPTIRARLAALALLLLVPALRGQGPADPPPVTPVAVVPEPYPEPGLPHSGFDAPAPAPPEQPLPRDTASPMAGLFGGFDPRALAMFRADYKATYFFNEQVSGQPTHLGYLEQDVSLAVPVYHDDCDVLALTFRGRNEHFSTDAILPGSGRAFPDDLWAVQLGTTYAHTFENGWVTGGTVSVGSASDRPFNSINEMTLGVNAFLRIPSGERNAWLFGLSYSPTSELGFPIPTVAYIYNPSDDLRVNIGLPFQVMYRPMTDLQLDFSYMLLRTVHARATYRVCREVRVHAGFDWGNEAYFLADRQNVNDRLFYYDKRLSAGVQYMVTPRFSLDLTGGYTFDRFYFEGAQYSDHLANELRIGNGAYLSFQGRLRW